MKITFISDKTDDVVDIQEAVDKFVLCAEELNSCILRLKTIIQKLPIDRTQEMQKIC
jgi:hypothetical protein